MLANIILRIFSKKTLVYLFISTLPKSVFPSAVMHYLAMPASQKHSYSMVLKTIPASIVLSKRNTAYRQKNTRKFTELHKIKK
jgi:hypothetical protein